ncbi:hypothetical protein EYF80_038823 [Liparis tanakae]|uniref:Uncharacterized protein n=1 Tax=Liparis tanakae TaxID=230148 RepID=A0A4Z2GCH0_9TELE|nr:hypothetical protein EYF80_038823 [Liparis tanakae]
MLLLSGLLGREPAELQTHRRRRGGRTERTSTRDRVQQNRPASLLPPLRSAARLTSSWARSGPLGLVPGGVLCVWYQVLCSPWFYGTKDSKKPEETREQVHVPQRPESRSTSPRDHQDPREQGSGVRGLGTRASWGPGLRPWSGGLVGPFEMSLYLNQTVSTRSEDGGPHRLLRELLQSIGPDGAGGASARPAEESMRR